MSSVTAAKGLPFRRPAEIGSIGMAFYRSVNKSMIVYAAFPKSGSQHLRNLIGKCTGSRTKIIAAKTSTGYGHNFISMRKLLTNPCFRKRLIVYGHFPYHQHNISMIEQFSAHPMAMISIRPLPDVVVSYKDHVDRAGFGPLDYRVHGMTECNAAWHELDEQRKYDYLIQFVMPWYVRFVAGWLEGSRRWPTELLTFEEYTRHPWQCLVNLGQAFRLDMDDEALEALKTPATVEKKNLNVGIGDRGREILSEEQHDGLRKLLSYYGNAFVQSDLTKYLLHGYRGLPFSVEDVIRNESHAAPQPAARLVRLIDPNANPRANWRPEPIFCAPCTPAA